MVHIGLHITQDKMMVYEMTRVGHTGQQDDKAISPTNR